MKRLLAIIVALTFALCAITASALAEEGIYAAEDGAYSPDEGETSGDATGDAAGAYSADYAEELTLSGTLKPVRELTVVAPFDGTVLAFELKAGDEVNTGDALFTLATRKVYAPVDGVISAIFAEEGESLDAIVYDAPMWLEPSSPYVINASTSSAYNATETKYVHAGERVSISATGSDERRANGVITSVNGSSYVVEVLDGNLRIGESCNISRSDDPSDNKLRIGGGKTARNNPVAIAAEGSVLKLHVKQGDTVKKGDLLMETVRGDLSGKQISGGEALSPVQGVITGVSLSVGMTVQENQALLTMHERGALEAAVLVDEDDLARIAMGDPVTVELDCASGELRAQGAVKSIARVPSSNEKGVAYEARVTFDNDDFVRSGMSVTVRK